MIENKLEKLNEEEETQVKTFLQLLELILKNRDSNNDKEVFKNDFLKYFNFLLQGRDEIHAFERRNAGVNDEVWNYSKGMFFKIMNIKEQSK